MDCRIKSGNDDMKNRSRDALHPSFATNHTNSLPPGKGRRSADRRNHPLSAPRKQVLPLACAAGAEARRSRRARLSALHRGSRLGDRTPPLSLGPRFLKSPDANGLLALSGASAASSSRTGRSAGRAGAEAAGKRDCESRPQAPHLLHLHERLAKASLDERDERLVTELATDVKSLRHYDSDAAPQGECPPCLQQLLI